MIHANRLGGFVQKTYFNLLVGVALLLPTQAKADDCSNVTGSREIAEGVGARLAQIPRG